jgi:hypothetical protein
VRCFRSLLYQATASTTTTMAGTCSIVQQSHLPNTVKVEERSQVVLQAEGVCTITILLVFQNFLPSGIAIHPSHH